MAEQTFIEQIATLGRNILPKDASLWLYGSRARGEAGEDSDWDLLILLNKDKREPADYEMYCWPFNDYGFTYNQYVSPKVYTRKEWSTLKYAPFAQNVEHDKIVLV